MMFEVQDLAVASPATVSRCGMVYLEPRNIGLQPFINCWLKRLPESIEPYKEMLNNLFAGFLEVKFLRCIFLASILFWKSNFMYMPTFS